MRLNLRAMALSDESEWKVKKQLKEIETPQLTSANLYFTGKIERRGELATGIGRRAYAVAIENDKIQHRTVIHFV